MIIEKLVFDFILFIEDIWKLGENDLCQFVDEVRLDVIDYILKIGGYFGVGLGVVELIVVLYYVFEILCDKIIWDVSYQCYLYKVLIGWCDCMGSICQKDGLFGFILC